jgi:hypothetical protein
LIFFSRSLNPVLDSGERNEDTVVTPEVPTGVAVRQAVLGHNSDGELLDAVGVMRFGQSQIGEIGGKTTATMEAAMAGESDNQVDGLANSGIAKVMQDTRTDSIAAGAARTARAGAGGPVATAAFQTRPGQVFDQGDALGHIRHILSWTNHRLPSKRNYHMMFILCIRQPDVLH